MSNRLRNQEVTAKPRIVVNGASFKVEWFGSHVKQHCSAGFQTFESAVQFANTMARWGAPEKVREINEQQRNDRHANILLERRAAAINQEAARS